MEDIEDGPLDGDGPMDEAWQWILVEPNFTFSNGRELIILGNNPRTAGVGDTIDILMAGPLLNEDGNRIYISRGRQPQFGYHQDDGHRAIPRNLGDSPPQLTEHDTGLVAVHDGSFVGPNDVDKPAGRYEYIPSNCPVDGYSGACFILLRRDSQGSDQIAIDAPAPDSCDSTTDNCPVE